MEQKSKFAIAKKKYSQHNNFNRMKIIKLIIATAILVTLLGACRSKLCPGYGELENDNQKTEQQA